MCVIGRGRIRELTLVLIQGSIVVQCSIKDSKHQLVDSRGVSTLVLHCVSLKCDDRNHW